MGRQQDECPSGPAASREGGRGFLSLGPMATEILCQAPHPAHGRGIHGARLAKVSDDAKPTDRLLSDLRYLRPGEHGAWCPVCKQVTVYRSAEAAA